MTRKIKYRLVRVDRVVILPSFIELLLSLSAQNGRAAAGAPRRRRLPGRHPGPHRVPDRGRHLQSLRGGEATGEQVAG